MRSVLFKPSFERKQHLISTSIFSASIFSQLSLTHSSLQKPFPPHNTSSTSFYTKKFAHFFSFSYFIYHSCCRTPLSFFYELNWKKHF
ncbi:hypothetical protein DU19_0142 [Chlamydia muridarum]|nr:hypothetical protein DU17_0142 [Chlamydia muridarum]KDU81121.1 hypothetical protein DU18_0143 [Chlamydia muridarum]KDU82546.1 hypothetical protein DU19_0142 [Chlamydia muridarum]KDU83073.1 hypothetical protein DU20_0142 [Chlamydia muridarum]KDU84525.1 hypothetical protein DU21_0142 [Chlamydia muridarum]